MIRWPFGAVSPDAGTGPIPHQHLELDVTARTVDARHRDTADYHGVTPDKVTLAYYLAHGDDFIPISLRRRIATPSDYISKNGFCKHLMLDIPGRT